MTGLLIEILLVINILVFIYFLIVNGSYITLIILSYFQVRDSKEKENIFELSGLFGTTLYPSASILAPAFNEELSIIESTRSLLNLNFSDYEVIVINDGSKDRTLEKLISHFELKEMERHVPFRIDTAPIKAIYGSRKHPNLIVVDKENGRKADALNAGINVSRKDLIFAVDSDSLLEANVLKKMLIAFTLDQETIAVGGVVRVANGCTFRHGVVEKVSVPKSVIGRIQAVEYLRSFLFGRTSWDYLDSLLIISGAFGVFDREMVIRVGGYLHDTVGEDMELVVRMHRYCRDHDIPYKIRFLPEPVCWTEVPESWSALGRQRNRWQRGLADTLFRHRGMFMNPKYGRLGFFAMPFFLFVELLSPIIELSGYLFFTASLILGIINWPFFLLFFAVCVLLGVVMSMLAVLLEELTMKRYERVNDVLILTLYAFLENFGYRQIHSWWRLRGLIDFLRGDKQWGEMTRKKTF
ncbi:MAG: glycosyltransferase [Balneolaceae bacterium]